MLCDILITQHNVDVYNLLALKSGWQCELCIFSQLVFNGTIVWSGVHVARCTYVLMDGVCSGCKVSTCNTFDVQTFFHTDEYILERHTHVIYSWYRRNGRKPQNTCTGVDVGTVLTYICSLFGHFRLCWESFKPVEREIPPHVRTYFNSKTQKIKVRNGPMIGPSRKSWKFDASAFQPNMVQSGEIWHQVSRFRPFQSLKNEKQPSNDRFNWLQIKMQLSHLYFENRSWDSWQKSTILIAAILDSSESERDN